MQSRQMLMDVLSVTDNAVAGVIGAVSKTHRNFLIHHKEAEEPNTNQRRNEDGAEYTEEQRHTTKKNTKREKEHVSGTEEFNSDILVREIISPDIQNQGEPLNNSYDKVDLDNLIPEKDNNVNNVHEINTSLIKDLNTNCENIAYLQDTRNPHSAEEGNSNNNVSNVPVSVSETSSSTGGSIKELIPIQRSCDLLKQGVFVLPNTMYHTRTDDRDDEKQTMKHVTNGNILAPKARRKATRLLYQGEADKKYVNSENGVFDGDVVATKFESQIARERLLHKLKGVAGKGRTKKIVKPVMVSFQEKNNAVAEVNEKVTERVTNTDKVVVEKKSEKPDSVSVVEATSAALGPFLKIQDALESQISSLVNSMKSAHEAQKELQQSEQDSRLARLEKQLADLREDRVNRVAMLSEGFRTHETTHMREIAPTTASMLYEEKVRDQPMVINRKKQGKVKYTIQDKRRDDKLFQGLIDSSRTLMPQEAPKRVVFTEEGKILPPTSEVKPGQAHMTSFSSESSSVASSSVLETPMPRHKIPVPAVRNVSAHSKDGGIINKRKRTNKGLNILKTILKGASGDEKENVYCVASSPVRRTKQERASSDEENIPTESIKVDDKEEKSFGVFKRDMKDIIKDAEVLRRKLNDINTNIGQNTSERVEEKIPSTDDERKTLVDTYLQMYPIKGRKEFAPEHLTKSSHDVTDASQHPSTAAHVLEDVAESRKRLENNIESIIRTRNQSRLYEMLEMPSSGITDEMADLRRKIDEKIREVSDEIEREITGGKHGKAPEVSRDNPPSSKSSKLRQISGNSRKGKADYVMQSSTKAKRNTKQSATTSSLKEKATRDPPKQVPSSGIGAVIRSPLIERSYKTSVYGTPAYFPHRSTTRPRGYTPVAVKYQTELPIAPKPASQPEQGVEYEDQKNQGERHVYYFQRDLECLPTGKHPPLHGNLVPVAIPIGKPRQDVALRLPLPSEVQEGAEESVIEQTDIVSPKRIEGGANVALFTVEATEIDRPYRHPSHRKKLQWLRKKERLAVQRIPAVDIESTDSSLLMAGEETSQEVEKKKNISLVPPTKDDYDEFQNFLSMQDIHATSNDVDEEETDAKAFDVEGQGDVCETSYHGPTFPPRQPSPTELPSEKLIVNSVRSIEERAQEWLEQELLARIVSQMASEPPDPTLLGRMDTVKATAANTDSDGETEMDTKDWIDSLIGLQGLQLFIDAGIPINEDLVQSIVREAIGEKLDTLFGFPKHHEVPETSVIQNRESSPDEAKTPISTPAVTPVYTPPESDAISEVRTPMPSSPDASTIEDADLLPVIEPIEEPEKEDDVPAPTVYIQTPPKTPSVTSDTTPRALEVGVTTPEPSESGGQSEALAPVATPEKSGEETQSDMDQEDFAVTEESPPSTPMKKEELSVPMSPKADSVKQVTVVANTRDNSEWSISSATYTMNTLSPESSTVAPISEGELLNPVEATSGPYSEGEFPVSPGQVAPHEETEKPVEVSMPDMRGILKRLTEKTKSTDVENREEPSSLTISPANTLKETEDIDEDTISGISKSEGELSLRDPLYKLISRINTPPDVYKITGRNGRTISQERSEGEVSLGEGYTVTPGASQAKRRIEGGDSMSQSSKLSAGEISPHHEIDGVTRHHQEVVEADLPNQFTNFHRNEATVNQDRGSLRYQEENKTNGMLSGRSELEGAASRVVSSTPAFPRLINVSGVKQDSTGLPQDHTRDEYNITTEDSIEKAEKKAKLLFTIPSADVEYDDQSENSLADLTDNVQVDTPSGHEISSLSEGEL